LKPNFDKNLSPQLQQTGCSKKQFLAAAARQNRLLLRSNPVLRWLRSVSVRHDLYLTCPANLGRPDTLELGAINHR
jgi:hypothetical protein